MSQTKTQLVEGLDLASAPADSLVIDSSGRVLIGTTTEGEANADDLTVASSGHTGITIRSGTTNRGNIYFSDATSGTGESAGYIQYNHDGNTLSLGTDTSTRLFINGSGDVGVNTTTFGSSAKFEVKSTTGSITSATSRINGGGTTTGAINTGASLLFAGHDGVNGRDFASLFAGKENGTSGNHDAYLAFGTRVNSGSVTEKLRITSDGKVGIGVSAPNAGLEINDPSSGDTYLRLSGLSNNTADANYAGIEFYNTDSSGIGPGVQAWIEARATGSTGAGAHLVFGTYPGTSTPEGARGIERMRITGDGNVGIGTTSPISILDVTVGGSGTRRFVANYDDSIVTAKSSNESSNPEALRLVGDNIRFNTGTSGSGTERARIDSSGRLLVGTSSAINTDGSSLLQVVGTSSGALLLARNDTETLSGDQIGAIRFFGNDTLTSGGYEECAAIKCNADADHTDSSKASRLVFFTTASGAESPTERMRIRADGTFVTASTTILNGNASTAISPRPIALAQNEMAWTAGRDGGTGGTNCFLNFCDQNGNLGANYALYVRGLTNSGAAAATLSGVIIDSTYVVATGVYNQGTTAGANVHVSSNGTLYRSTSSIRFKTDVETIEDSYSDALLQCRPVWYRSTASGDTQHPDWGYWGFIAEELAEIDPRLVFWKTHETTTDIDGNTTTEELAEPIAEGVQYDRFVPHLLNLIKRQKEQIEALEARLTAAGI